MTRKHIILLLIIILVVIASYVFFLKRLSERSIIIHNYKLNVEIPKLKSEYEKGLSGRKSLKENQGMLFIFPKEAYWPFWMPKMHFPIGIIWLDKECQVVYIERNLPPCERTSDCPQVTPDKPAQYVLETIAGFAEKHQIIVGEKLEICN